MGSGFGKRGFGTAKHRFLNLIDSLSFARIFLIWLGIAIFFGTIYFGLSFSEGNSLMYQGNSLSKDITGFLDSQYFSFITATTTGFGDITPLGIAKLFSVLEAIFGVIMIGIIVAKVAGIKQEVILEEIYNISYEEVVDRLKNGLYIFRSDINRTLEKIEIGTIKKREIRDMWILFSGLDNSLTNIRNFMIPPKNDSLYSKKFDTLKLELLLNSIKLSMRKISDFIRSVKSHELEWRNELLLTSIYYDIQIVNEIIDFESKKINDKKIIERLNELKVIIGEIEEELKPEKKEEKESLGEISPPIKEDLREKEPETLQEEMQEEKFYMNKNEAIPTDNDEPGELVDVKQPETIDLPVEEYNGLEDLKAKDELPEFPEHGLEEKKEEEGYDEQEKS